MTTIPESKELLRDFYDPSSVSDEEVSQELHRIRTETEVDRTWMEATKLQPFHDRTAILQSVVSGELEKVVKTVGITPIARLRTLQPDYSEPLLRPRVADVARQVGRTWFEHVGVDEDGIWSLSVTSMVRSVAYQREIASQPRKPAVDPKNGEHSSHEFGYAFDLDGAGLYLHGDEGPQGIHPRTEHDFHAKIQSGRDTLREILSDLASNEIVNVCEEVPGTQQWCFHVCVNPLYERQ